LVRVHMSDVQAAARRIKTLIIEANGRSWHRHIYDCPQYRLSGFGSRRRVLSKRRCYG
jgi:hypothetical protein